MYAESIAEFVLAVSNSIEVLAAIVVGYGAIVATVRALFVRRGKHREHFENARIDLGRTLTLGLELEIGADLLRVAQSPSWNRIGILAAIIAVRSILNYLLQHDIEHLEHSLETHQGKQAESSQPKNREKGAAT